MQHFMFTFLCVCESSFSSHIYEYIFFIKIVSIFFSIIIIIVIIQIRVLNSNSSEREKNTNYLAGIQPSWIVNLCEHEGLCVGAVAEEKKSCLSIYTHTDKVHGKVESLSQKLSEIDNRVAFAWKERTNEWRKKRLKNE